MIKKMIYLGILLVMLFSLAACQGSELLQYKNIANGLIDDYISNKNQSDYTADNWAVLQQAVTDGKNAVYKAGNKSGVDTAVTLAKKAVDVVPMEDLKWNEALENRIKQDYFKKFNKKLLYDRFYGIYNRAVVFFFSNESNYRQAVIISGVEFTRTYDWTILVWENGNFYDLEDIDIIFNAGILTQSDVEQIGSIHIEANANPDVEGKEINFSVGFSDLQIFYSGEHDLKYIAETFDEWKGISGKREYLQKLNEKYTEQYFVNNSLIVYAFTKGRGINQINIKKISRNGNGLLVETDIILDYTEAISKAIVIIEVAKTDVANISSLRIIQNSNM